MSGIYRSSENNEILKSSGPHREISTDRLFVNGRTLKIEINNTIMVDEAIEVGQSYDAQISIDVNSQNIIVIPEQ